MSHIGSTLNELATFLNENVGTPLTKHYFLAGTEKHEPPISHTKSQECIVKHMCLTIVRIFANHHKRPRSLQNTIHRAIE